MPAALITKTTATPPKMAHIVPQFVVALIATAPAAAIPKTESLEETTLSQLGLAADLEADMTCSVCNRLKIYGTTNDYNFQFFL